MNTLMRVPTFDPLNHFRVNRFFDDFFQDGLASNEVSFRVDVKETDTAYTIEADLPGVKKEELSIDLDDGILTIAVSRNSEVEDKHKGYLRRERRVESMQRALRLPQASQESTAADLKDGVLTITAQKIPPIERKTRIAIQ
jgi:HSP20 family protein